MYAVLALFVLALVLVKAEEYYSRKKDRSQVRQIDSGSSGDQNVPKKYRIANEHKASELKFWNFEKSLSLVTTVSAALAFLISVSAFHETQETTRQIRRQADIAHDAERPWIAVKAISSISYDKAARSLSMTVSIFNFGKSPNLGYIKKFDVVDGSDWRGPLGKICEDMERSLTDDKLDSLFVVLPQQPTIFEAPIEDRDLPNNPHIVGCIAYKWSGKTYRTGFVTKICAKADSKFTPYRLYTVNSN